MDKFLVVIVRLQIGFLKRTMYFIENITIHFTALQSEQIISDKNNLQKHNLRYH